MSQKDAEVGLGLSSVVRPPAAAELEIAMQNHFGVLPNFFRLSADTPEIMANLWGFAQAAYLDSVLPSLFKERLFVFLSRFCRVRYCVARHVGFLVGLGRPSGDAKSPIQTVEEIVRLLRRPFPRGQELKPWISLCEAAHPLREVPGADSEMEQAIFACAGHVFLQTPDALACRDALNCALGRLRLAQLIVFLAFVRTAHYWTQVHSELTLEDDVKQLLATHEALAHCILHDPEAASDEASQNVLDDLASLRKRAGRQTNLLAAIVDSSDDAIVSKGLDGVITSWNKGAERMFGYTAEEAVGEHITLVIPPARWQEEVTILDRLGRGERVDHFETVRVRKDGTPLNVSLTISPVRDADGHIIGASKVARDITERKQVERALAERARLLDLSNDAIIARDAADRVTYWNKGAAALYGYSREDARGRVTHELLRTEFPVPLERIMAQLYSEGRWAGELVHTRNDGTRVVVASRWALDRDADGNPASILETNNDISQQKQSEKALRESSERFRALADSLETQVRLRTEELEARNAEILQQSDQLRRLSNRVVQTQDDERRHIARELHDSAGQILAGLAMNLSALSRLAKEISPEIADRVDENEALVQQLNQEIRTMSYLLHPPLLDETGLLAALRWYVHGLVERSGLEISLSLAEDFGRLPGDMELMIFRLVQECLTNIHRHSGSKTAKIRISRDAETVFLEVQDQGQGMPAAKLAEINAQRSGVGIAGMRERVRHFRGAINIQSSDQGTRISFRFPVQIAASEQQGEIQEPSAQAFSAKL